MTMAYDDETFWTRGVNRLSKVMAWLATPILTAVLVWLSFPPAEFWPKYDAGEF